MEGDNKRGQLEREGPLFLWDLHHTGRFNKTQKILRTTRLMNPKITGFKDISRNEAISLAAND